MIPEKYQQMLEKGVDVVALRVAMIGELDRKNANVVAIGDALNEVLKAKGLSLFEDDDEVVDFAVGANADAKLVEIKASLRMNFSREKIVFASQLIGGSVKRTATGIKKMSEPREDSKIVQLKRSAVAGDKVPDKLAKAGLTTTKSELVNAPIINELPMSLECKVKSFDNGILVGEIVNVNADESILTDGKVDPMKLKPITYDPVGNKYIALGNVVGQAFSDGNKMK